MSWDGYFKWDDIEIVNTARTAAYARSRGVNAFRTEDCDLAGVFGTTYTDPSTDYAKPDWPGNWFDIDEPVSGGFCGFVPLKVEGLAGSTYTAQVKQDIISGGTVGSRRHNHREVRFVGTLVGVDRSSALYGLDWLTQSLIYGWMCRQPVVLRGKCNDIELQWYQQCPDVCGTGLHPVDPNPPAGDQTCPNNLRRKLLDASVIQAPVVLSEQELPGCGGYLIHIEFIIASESPYVWWEKDDIENVDLASLSWANVPILRMSPRAGVAQAPCYLDPTCTYADPPAYVQTLDQCAVPPTSWQRAKVTIPNAAIPEVTRVVPRFQLINTAAAGSSGFVKVMFTEGGTEPETEAFAEVLIHHIPKDGALTYEGHRDRVKLRCGNRTTIANHLADVTVKDSKRSRDDDLLLVMACGAPVDVWFYRAQTVSDLAMDLDLNVLRRAF